MSRGGGGAGLEGTKGTVFGIFLAESRKRGFKVEKLTVFDNFLFRPVLSRGGGGAGLEGINGTCGGIGTLLFVGFADFFLRMREMVDGIGGGFRVGKFSGLEEITFF